MQVSRFGQSDLQRVGRSTCQRVSECEYLDEDRTFVSVAACTYKVERLELAVRLILYNIERTWNSGLLS